MGRIIALILFLGAAYFLYVTYGYRYAVSHVVNNADTQMMLGDKNPSINILAYVDYDSESSRRLFPVLLNLIATDQDVRLIIHPVATDKPTSQLATRLVLAAKKQGRFLDLNNAFLSANNALDENYMETIARSLRIDYDALKANALSADIESELANYKKESVLLNANDLPTFFVNHIKMTGSTHTVPDLSKLMTDIRLGRR
jgi:protein-disulfide isomerase